MEKHIGLENRLLFINDDVIVINKLAGEAMEGATEGMIDLPALLLRQFGAGENGTETGGKHDGKAFAPAAVHRLDVPVTGCALFARNTAAAAFLNNSFARTVDQEGRAEKYYWAIVELSPAFSALPDTGELVHWIRANPKKNKSAAFNKPAPHCKEAILRYRVRGKGRNYGFLEIELVTGRHHQIRAQLAALGLHIKGDIKYGARRSEKEGGIRLHSHALYFPDPSMPQNTIHVKAPPPLQDTLWCDFVAFT
ncbi:MAG: RNA pseudouridine synthase [Spirochaetaceae bacterium]|nr:RNA pseudouridine synthase [Spirochaetaceae bacterium]